MLKTKFMNSIIYKRQISILIAMFVLTFCRTLIGQYSAEQNWIHYARITGNILGLTNIEKTMQAAVDHGTLGIELDNDITGRYDSFLDPTLKLRQIKKAADAAHKIGNYAFIYIAGLECIAENADKTEHTMFKDHPDWVQRDINGKPAIFKGDASFWVSEGDEDAWISPYAMEWRKRYMEIVRQIAATGIDGVYIDVAYWMWLYEGWENSWVSFDDYTVAEFKKRAGIDARKDFIPGDFNDPDFLKWIDFRIQTITEFFKEIEENVKSVNPDCIIIPEVSPSVNSEVVRSGADVYEIRKYSEVITHEFFINTNTGAKRNTFDWLTYVIGISTLRAFDEDKATWLLSYSWDHEVNTNPQDAMKLLSCAQVMAGANYWDAPGHLMAGSNDYSLRKEIFKWIEENENLIYSPRKSLNPIGVYYSPATRNYFTDYYIKSFYGLLHLLVNNHLNYQVVTPRTLNDFTGNLLVLPDVRILEKSEIGLIKQKYEQGLNLILTGESGYYNKSRKTENENNILKILREDSIERGKFLFIPECPGKKYFESHDTLLIKNFNDQVKDFLPSINLKYRIKASLNVSTIQAELKGKDCIYITNLKGLKGYSSCIPTTEVGIEIEFESDKMPVVWFIPYLGDKMNLNENKLMLEKTDHKIKINLPPIKFGGIVEIEK
jgi:hypothetical protein